MNFEIWNIAMGLPCTYFADIVLIFAYQFEEKGTEFDFWMYNFM